MTVKVTDQDVFADSMLHMALLAWKNGDITMIELKKVIENQKAPSTIRGLENVSCYDPIIAEDKYDYSVSKEEQQEAQKFFSSDEFREVARKLTEGIPEPQTIRGILERLRAGLNREISKDLAEAEQALEQLFQERMMAIIGEDELVRQDEQLPSRTLQRKQIAPKARNHLRHEQRKQLDNLIHEYGGEE